MHSQPRSQSGAITGSIVPIQPRSALLWCSVTKQPRFSFTLSGSEAGKLTAASSKSSARMTERASSSRSCLSSSDNRDMHPLYPAHQPVAETDQYLHDSVPCSHKYAPDGQHNLDGPDPHSEIKLLEKIQHWFRPAQNPQVKKQPPPGNGANRVGLPVNGFLCNAVFSDQTKFGMTFRAAPFIYFDVCLTIGTFLYQWFFYLAPSERLSLP